MLKRSFDLTAAAFALFLLAPVFVLVALVVRLTSTGPVFYRGKRVGLNGSVFRMYKFRTMVANAEQLGGSCTSDRDARITRAGRWLRKRKLDELPQFINVVRGEMSLVGPRPEVEVYVQRYTEEERAILSVRPGITDWASIWDCDEGQVLALRDDAEQAYLELIRPEKIRLQLEYVRRRSFWVDLGILLGTARVLFLHRSPISPCSQT